MKPDRMEVEQNFRSLADDELTQHVASGTLTELARRAWVRSAAFTVFAYVLAGGPIAQAADAEQKFPDVVSAKVVARGPGSFDFDVTVSSAYDSPRRYADAFRTMSKDGKVFGERILWHDHAGEQPFTRDLYGVIIPVGVRTVVIQARDQKYGYGGKTLEVALPRR